MAPALPRGFPIWDGFVVIAGLWLGVALIARVWWGSTAGALVPLGLAVVFGSTIIPWEFSIVFNDGLSPFRLGLAAVFIVTGVVSYARIGTRAG